MELKRFFVDKSSLIGDTIILTDVEHNHLSNVLRLKEGTSVLVVMGDGYDYECEIVSISKKSSTLKVISRTENVYDPRINITFYQGIIKGDNMPLVVQKLNELGISTLVPMTSKYTVALGGKNLVSKLQSTANQSVKQCRRSTPIRIEDIMDIFDIVHDFDKYDIVLLCYEREDATTMQSVLSGFNLPKNIAVVIGSEGGFSEEEVDLLTSHGAKSITMGRRILRAETASIAMASALMYSMGEWNI